MKKFLSAGAAILAFFMLGVQTAYAAATILPPAETCFQATAGVNGMVGALGTITGGTGGAAGTYAGVALTGGSGSGATANIVVAGGVVTSVTILNPGTQYVVGDTLSATAATIGNTSGFSVPVLSVAINSSLAGGSVTFYIPNTTTFKQTWKNAAQTVLNTNPVTLDQNGCMIAYGTGIYRQILKDNLGNTVFDQVTADVSANNSTFWAGVAGGTPNVITVVDAGFNATDGSIINFTALATNTGPATLNPSGFGAIPVLKDTTAGPVALTGSEIIQSNPISVIFRASDNAFHLLNTVIASASGATAPLCGASGLKIVNNSGTPDTIITITANQVVLQTPSGLVINRSAVSQNVNITLGTTTAAAGGMDGESAGTSAWLYVWLIDNGAAPAAMTSAASGNGLAPTMPSGYTYKCRVGTMRVDGSTHLLRTLQTGSDVQYTVTAATNTAALPTLVSGPTGTYSNTVFTGTLTAIGTVAPPTAARFKFFLSTEGNAQAVALAPNTGYSGFNGTNAVPWSANGTTTGAYVTGDFQLESTNVFFAGGANAHAQAVGWKDAVNAN